MTAKRRAWPRTVGRTIRTDAGNVAHVQVSADITPDELDTLRRLIDAAYKYAEKKQEKGQGNETDN